MPAAGGLAARQAPHAAMATSARVRRRLNRAVAGRDRARAAPRRRPPALGKAAAGSPSRRRADEPRLGGGQQGAVEELRGRAGRAAASLSASNGPGCRRLGDRLERADGEARPVGARARPRASRDAGADGGEAAGPDGHGQQVELRPAPARVREHGLDQHGRMRSAWPRWTASARSATGVAGAPVSTAAADSAGPSVSKARSRKGPLSRPRGPRPPRARSSAAGSRCRSCRVTIELGQPEQAPCIVR